MKLHIVILAAGQGKRMFSNLPKVLHPLAGKPMLQRVVDTALQLQPEAIHVIYGHGGELLQQSLPDLPVNWILQAEQLGTGHAVLQALPHIPMEAHVLVLSADVPLIKVETLAALIEGSKTMDSHQSTLTLLVANLVNPTGLGRIKRDSQDEVYAIVEEKDANEQEKKIQEIYSGICCTHAHNFARWLPELGNDNAQGEYYLTEIIARAVADQVPVHTVTVDDVLEITGVNSRLQLQQLERAWQTREAIRLLNLGVGIADAQRFDVRGELICGKDVFIDINCIFEGKVILHDGCSIGPHSVLKNAVVGMGTKIHAYSHLEACEIGPNCAIGPFARLRTGTHLDENCRVGNFVETKNAQLGKGAKASHLSYLGDVTMGKNVNIGAGTITCNYDGANKHKTIIEDEVFVGSDTQLVAPVHVGANATIGAGSTIRKDVPPGELTLTFSQQKTITGWKRAVKKSL